MKSVLLLSAAALALGWLGFGTDTPPAPRPETAAIPAGTIAYRPEGGFERDGKVETPRPETVSVAGFEIMVRQVSQAQYAACVTDGACQATAVMGAGDAPQTHLNWYDAQDFAAWFSDRTGMAWRLPTDREWQRAAAETFGEAVAESGGIDPGRRMIERYRAGLDLRGRSDALAENPAQANSLGVQGMSDTVWEWTEGCMINGALDAEGRIETAEPYCAARVVGGRHRAVVIDFIRDASVGGCAVGLPPDYLGLRLVRGD